MWSNLFYSILKYPSEYILTKKKMIIWPGFILFNLWTIFLYWFQCVFCVLIENNVILVTLLETHIHDIK